MIDHNISANQIYIVGTGRMGLFIALALTTIDPPAPVSLIFQTKEAEKSFINNDYNASVETIIDGEKVIFEEQIEDTMVIDKQLREPIRNAIVAVGKNDINKTLTRLKNSLIADSQILILSPDEFSESTKEEYKKALNNVENCNVAFARFTHVVNYTGGTKWSLKHTQGQLEIIGDQQPPNSELSSMQVANAQQQSSRNRTGSIIPDIVETLQDSCILQTKLSRVGE